MKSILSFLLLITSFFVFGQVDAEVNVFNAKDSSQTENIYYTDLTDKLLLKFTNNIKFTGLRVTNTNTNRTVKLAPAGSLDLGFNYKWLGLGFTYGLPTGAVSDSTKGKTRKFDLQLNIYSKRVVIDGVYQKYKGFHIENPDDLANWDTTTVFPQLPDMENYSLGASA